MRRTMTKKSRSLAQQPFTMIWIVETWRRIIIEFAPIWSWRGRVPIRVCITYKKCFVVVIQNTVHRFLPVLNYFQLEPCRRIYTSLVGTYRKEMLQSSNWRRMLAVFRDLWNVPGVAEETTDGGNRSRKEVAWSWREGDARDRVQVSDGWLGCRDNPHQWRNDSTGIVGSPIF